MPIPQKLKDMRIWTLSTKDKLPLDVGFLHSASEYVLFTPKWGSRCYKYDVCKKIQQQFPDTKMTIKANSNHNLTLVDIEKEGNGNFNPYLKLDFIYLEKSTNGGLHGLLDYKLDTKPIIKDHEFQTEFFNDNHFMIITENEIDIINQQYQLFDFKNRLQPKEKSEQIFDIDMEYQTTLKDVDKKRIQKELFVKPYSVANHQDKSREEMKYVTNLGYKILKKFKYEDINHFISLLEYACDLHLPYRHKHEEEFNAEGYGHLTKRKYMIIRAAEYILEND